MADKTGSYDGCSTEPRVFHYIRHTHPRQCDINDWEPGNGGAFTPALILFVALPDTKDNIIGATCAMGKYLNRHQYRQRCDRPRTFYLAFDADPKPTEGRAWLKSQKFSTGASPR